MLLNECGAATCVICCCWQVEDLVLNIGGCGHIIWTRFWMHSLLRTASGLCNYMGITVMSWPVQLAEASSVLGLLLPIKRSNSLCCKDFGLLALSWASRLTEIGFRQSSCDRSSRMSWWEAGWLDTAHRIFILECVIVKLSIYFLLLKKKKITKH